MRKMNPPVVLIDANVLYSASLRNFFLNVAFIKLFEPKWSAEINVEWTRNLLQKRSDIKEEIVMDKVKAMNDYFLEANIENYEHLIPTLQLPDPNDRHVLAAAIKGKAKIITTANLKDFPQDYIRQFDIDVQHPDDFIMDLLVEQPKKVLKAFQMQVENLKNPPLSEAEVLLSLEKNGLEKTVLALRKMIQ